jgi:hypothetical protein
MAPDVDLMPAMQTMMKHYGTSTGSAAPDIPQPAVGHISKAQRCAPCHGPPPPTQPARLFRDHDNRMRRDVAGTDRRFRFRNPADYQIMDVRKRWPTFPPG